ncbi:BTB/POZ domain-containing protein 3-like [Contarinia nasturtii]|uniref:BTB/POZ domain-containing protein 3-like n=1 Tax=Contarinia nasturtii TaxID=265458 RepID=UPI0012D45F10|nr:BTB/POZ domain-containing protein 3-like [Contarinia nasturtii]
MADVNFLFYEENTTDAGVKKLIGKVPAHKDILASANPVFYAEFYGSIKEQGEVEIVDSSPDAFKEFLQYFYCGRVTFTMDNISEIMYLANKYMIADCMDACTKYLTDNLTLKDIWWAYFLCILHDRQQLKQFCEEQITWNADTLLKSDEFLACSQKSLHEILKMDLHCRESIVFGRCLAWAKNACQQNGLDENDESNLRNQLGDCLFLIRFGTMTLDEFSEYKCYGMFTADEVLDIVRSITFKGFFSKKFNQLPRRFWDESKVWMCRPNQLDKCVQVQRHENVFITSNAITLLGGVYFTKVRRNSGDSNTFNAIVSIEEINGHTFATETGTVLFKETQDFVCNTEGYIKLPIPIVINPCNTYHICLDVTHPTGSLYSYRRRLGKVRSNNSLIITFQNDYGHYHRISRLELIDF